MKSLLKIRYFIQPYKMHVAGAILSLVGVTASRLVVPGIIRDVIDNGLTAGSLDVLIRAAWLILGIGLIRAVFVFTQQYLSNYVSMRAAYDTRNRLYNHIQHLSFSFHDHAQTGQLMSRCTEDVRSIQNFIGNGFIEITQITLLLVGGMGLMFLENPRLAALALAPMIPLVMITTGFGSRASKLFYAVDKALGDLSSRLQENVSGAQVVRAFSREPFEKSRFEEKNKELFNARVFLIGEWSKVMPTTHFLVALSTILILYFGGQMVMSGEITLGQIVAFNGYMLLLALPAQQLTWFVNGAGEAAAGVQRVFEVLDQQPEIKSQPNALIPEKISGRVEFKQVSFTYQGESKPALSDISFTAEPNQTIALIGATGSGKTTLVNLISRFYDVDQGAVLVDGYDVRHIDLDYLRRQVGIVLQTSLLFSASIQENIAFGRPQAGLEEIYAAARAAQADEFISAFPEGYQTVVGERGITLSGGQRQRTAIARALLVDPRILILDDSTSSVDTETEHLIQKALDELMKNRTTFVIAQRLSTVRNADLILVIENGKIVERGKHADLLKNDGPYREIYDLQLAQQERYIEDLQAAKSGRKNQ
ncbi:MAG: ABC transporter ATP-binding protein/permease [Anaerolineae bacterium]|nr:ABC transporter ATP-binding protein/permease [Anaerolineae bacterium]